MRLSSNTNLSTWSLSSYLGKWVQSYLSLWGHVPFSKLLGQSGPGGPSETASRMLCPHRQEDATSYDLPGWPGTWEIGVESRPEGEYWTPPVQNVYCTCISCSVLRDLYFRHCRFVDIVGVYCHHIGS